LKSRLHYAILILIVVGAHQPAKAQTPNGAQLLREVQAKYASLQSYSAIGEVLSGLNVDGSSAVPPASKATIRIAFTIKLARPQMYRITWNWEQKTERQALSSTSKGAVWSDGQSRFMTSDGKVTQPADTLMATSGASGASGGASNTIPSIFFDLGTNGIKAPLREAVLAGEESIDGEPCYVLKTSNGHFDHTLWISKASQLIRQQMTVSSRSAVTPLAKAAKSSYSVEIHRNIKTNEVMLPDDFR
jgi:hypothetical protein